ncbi:unnamed protein product [Prorocentrum cordatum]|uniref:Rhodanese domain-containing protein n=1 Tax=Prorocentrum cordatum TaxID=2364126 RepID=A0ABN9UR19_9DINO|nr:unnamed protein product [Polarella glacialis]
MTERSRDAALAAVARYTAAFADDREFSLIPTSELRAQSRPVVLVDCREQEEQRTSMIPGAITQAFFEEAVLPKLCAQKRGGSASDDEEPLVVPYCTVGYRSGLYCRDLVRVHGLRHVRNGEGVIMWTFDGDGLVRPFPGDVPRRAPTLSGRARQAPPLPGAVAEHGAAGDEVQPEVVQEVHVYGKRWDMAAEGYETQYFTAGGGASRFLVGELRRRRLPDRVARAAPWMWAFAMLYFFFVPACGIMFDCGCQFADTKWSQFKTCNVRNRKALHKCPWCTCEGIGCIFVASDMNAFFDKPIVDALPNGFFVTVFTVMALYPTFKLVDRTITNTSELPGAMMSTMVKLLLGTLWFFSYCLVVGLVFFNSHSDYPYFIGFVREATAAAGS